MEIIPLFLLYIESDTSLNKILELRTLTLINRARRFYKKNHWKRNDKRAIFTMFWNLLFLLHSGP